MAVVPSFIIRHVFSYFDLQYQLRILALVCRSWHHGTLCMNCISTNVSEQDVKQWFARYFDLETVNFLIPDFKSVVGAPHSYVVRHLVLLVLRDIQEAVPNIEIEIFVLYSQLAKAHNRSEKLLKVYQVSALLYLLKKLESTFNIYDIFNNVELALGNIKIPICRRDCLKMLIHVGAMLRFRFDQNGPHINDTDFHMRAAIKCFDVKLLIKKSPPWLAIFELLEATIGPKFLKPNTVFPNFYHKLVEICKNDFADFNELLYMLESDLVLDSNDGANTEPSETLMPRIGITKFPVITNDFIAQYIALPPSEHCDRHHSILDAHGEGDPHETQSDSGLSTPRNTARGVRSAHGTPSQHDGAGTPSKYTMNNNNYTPNNNNSPNRDSAAESDTRHDDESSDASDTKNWSDASNSQSPTYCYEEPHEVLALAANPHHETTTIHHAETKTNNDESTVTHPNKETASCVTDEALDLNTYMQPVEDYRYFFDSEENSMEEDDEELVDNDEYEEFEDDEKENEPPAKFVKINTNNSAKCDVHNT